MKRGMPMTRKSAIRVGALGTLGALLAVLWLHPYTRQSVIGPKIRGVPLCVWQKSFRDRYESQPRSDSLFAKLLGWSRVQPVPEDPWALSDAERLPILVSLIDDPNPEV